MKKQVDLLPVVTLVAVIIFGSLFGFLGIFLSVPLVIVFKIWIQETLIEDILNKWHKEESIYDDLTNSSEAIQPPLIAEDNKIARETEDSSQEPL